MKKRLWQVSLIVAALTLTGCTTAVTEKNEDTEDDTSVSEDAAPISDIRAADDFYGYVNLSELDSYDVKGDEQSAGSFDVAADLVDEQLDEILKDIYESNKTYPKGSNEQLVHDLYEQFVTFEGPGSDTEKFFDDVIAKIDSVSTVKEYTDLMAELKRDYDVDILLSFSTDMNYYDCDHYAASINGVGSVAGTPVYELSKKAGSSKNLSLYIQSVLKALGSSKEEAEDHTREMMYYFIDISNNTYYDEDESMLDQLERNSVFTFDEANEILSSFDLRDYYGAFGVEPPKEIYMLDSEQVEFINTMLRDEELPVLKDYAKCEFINNYGSYLPDKYKHIRNKYFDNIVDNREKYAKNTVARDLMVQMGELYYDRYATEDTIEKITKICEEIKEQYHSLINGADWLSADARRLICKKLDNVQFVIGSGTPHEIDPKDSELIGEDLLHSLVNIRSARAKEAFSNIGKDYPKLEMQMPSHTVNACYLMQNTINIPLAILNKPFFDPDAPEAQNLGAIGHIIAHELSHAFDSECIAFDANGSYDPGWIAEEDRNAFEEKMEKVRKYYDDFTIIDVYYVDGELTLGENFADLGGFECVMSIADSDAEKKMLMESYAKVWCELIDSNYAILLLREDVHSPSNVRVNAVLSSCDEFYRLYDVKEGDGMYIAPEERVSRW